jgi:hypothetical protein
LKATQKYYYALTATMELEREASRTLRITKENQGLQEFPEQTFVSLVVDAFVLSARSYQNALTPGITSARSDPFSAVA